MSPSEESSHPFRLSLEVHDPGALREVVGELGQHLKIIAKAHGTRLGQRGATVTISGSAEAVELSAQVV